MSKECVKWYTMVEATPGALIAYRFDEESQAISKAASQRAENAADGKDRLLIWITRGVDYALDFSPRLIQNKPAAKPAAVAPASALVPCIAVIKPGATPDDDVLCTGQGPKGGRLAGICSEHAKAPTTAKDEWRARRKGRKA